MTSFYHAKTDKYMKRARFFAAALGIPCSMPVLLAFISLLLEFRQYDKENFLLWRFAVIAGCILLWMLLSFAVFAVQKTKMKRVSRYTYFEILPKAMVLSCYAGGYSLYGSRNVRRKIYVIPVRDTEIKFDRARSKVTFKGRIRMYEEASDRLGYNTVNGRPDFENWWLNENGYTEITRLTLPKNIMRPKTLYRSAVVTQKMYKLREEAAIKRRLAPVRKPVARPVPKKRIYNSIPTFDRKW